MYGETRSRGAPELAKVCRERWSKMSPEERIEVTREAKVFLTERRKAKATAVHNVPIAAFHDVRATLASMKKQVCY